LNGTIGGGVPLRENQLKKESFWVKTAGNSKPERGERREEELGKVTKEKGRTLKSTWSKKKKKKNKRLRVSEIQPNTSND